MEYYYITGCDTGFGKILMGKLDKLGFGVFAGCYLQSTVDEYNKEDDNVVAIQVDVSKEDSVENAASQIRAHLEASPGSVLKGLVNNAGILIAPGPVEWTDVESYKRMFGVNVLGTVMVTKSVLPLIRASQGRIVNVASIAGRMGMPSQPAYCVSKYGVEAYSDVLRQDMLPWNVTVSIIEPGVFSKTGLYSDYQVGLDRNWKNLSQNLKDDYGEDFYLFFRRKLGSALSMFGNTNSNLVPEAMVEALTSAQPKYRYRVGFDSKYLITAANLMHESTADFIWNLPDPKNPTVNPATAPKNGTQKCTARYKKSSFKWWVLLALAIFFIRRRMK